MPPLLLFDGFDITRLRFHVSFLSFSLELFAKEVYNKTKQRIRYDHHNNPATECYLG
jgi:hypothetical protein